MGEIKVGVYARSRSGYIGKIRVIIDHMIFLNGNNYYHHVNDIEASYDLLDLIKPGDYVNGHKVLKTNCKLEYIDDDSDTGVDEVYNGLEIEGYPTWIYFESEIKSVVTKEEFEEISFKVR